jgi:hypothetical protein
VNKTAAIAIATSSVSQVRRPVRASAGTVVANAIQVFLADWPAALFRGISVKWGRQTFFLLLFYLKVKNFESFSENPLFIVGTGRSGVNMTGPNLQIAHFALM